MFTKLRISLNRGSLNRVSGVQYVLLSFDRQLQGWFLSVIVQISIFIIVGFNSHSLFTSGVNSQDGIFSFLLLEFSICIVIQLKPGKNKYICITDGQNSTIYNRFAKISTFSFLFFPFFLQKAKAILPIDIIWKT